MKILISLQTLTDLIDACKVFHTPIERRKHWNEYKEDAADRLNKMRKIVDAPEQNADWGLLIIKAKEKANKLRKQVYVIESTPFEHYFATDEDFMAINSTNSIVFSVFPDKL